MPSTTRRARRQMGGHMGRREGRGKDERVEDRQPRPGGGLPKADAALREACDGQLTRLSERGWWLSRADVVVIAVTVTICLAVAAWLWVPALDSPTGDAAVETADKTVDETAGETSGAYAVVQNTRGFYEVLPLDQDVSVTVTSELGTNEIEVAGGAVRVVSSDCANQVCVDSGWASFPGQTITCLPHELVIQVVSDPEDAATLS